MLACGYCCLLLLQYYFIAPSVMSKKELSALPELIALVRDQPLLWNVKHRYYRSTYKREAAWRQIALTLDSSFQQVDEHESKHIVSDIIKRWKGVRDSFFNSRRRKQKNPYIYDDQLQFLLKLKKNSPKTEATQMTNTRKINKKMENVTNADNDNHNNDNHDKDMDVVYPSADNGGIQLRIMPTVDFYDTTTITQDVAGKSEATTAVDASAAIKTEANAIEKFYEHNATTLQPSSYKGHNATMFPQHHQLFYDEDQSFFDSLRPSVRDLNESENFEFRIEVMTILKRIKEKRTNSNV